MFMCILGVGVGFWGGGGVGRAGKQISYT